jgi:hypothetical protein
MLHIEPVTLREANALVEQWHRHHKPSRGQRFALGVFDDEGVPHGAAIVGRPVSGGKDQMKVAEVSRLVTDGTFNACSMLYAACARASRAMGFRWIQTYILQSEPGTSLKASGWLYDGLSCEIGWNNGNRPRDLAVPDKGRRKQRWKLMLNTY